jgi:hypothetical protein
MGSALLGYWACQVRRGVQAVLLLQLLMMLRLRGAESSESGVQWCRGDMARWRSCAVAATGCLLLSVCLHSLLGQWNDRQLATY